jgi:Concanavalin A-like lectin/glucanases superfamily
MMDFGSAGWIQTPYTTNLSVYTYAFRGVRSGGSGLPRIIDKGLNELIFINISSNSLRYRRRWNSQNTEWSLRSVSDGASFNVCFTYNSNNAANVPFGFNNGIVMSINTILAPTGSIIGTGSNPYRIGASTSTGTNPFAGSLGEVAVWNAAIPEEMMIAISAGYSPMIWQRNLIFYYPLIADTKELTNRYSTSSGGLTVVPHARVIYPS